MACERRAEGEGIRLQEICGLVSTFLEHRIPPNPPNPPKLIIISPYFPYEHGIFFFASAASVELLSQQDNI